MGIEQLRQLPDTYRDAVLLEAAGLSHAEIAGLIEVPLEAVEGILRLGRAKLQRIRATAGSGTGDD